MQFRLVADDNNVQPYHYDSGYVSSPTGLTAALATTPNKVLFTTADDKKVYLIFFVKDCEDNVESLTVTLNQAYFV